MEEGASLLCLLFVAPFVSPLPAHLTPDIVRVTLALTPTTHFLFCSQQDALMAFRVLLEMEEAMARIGVLGDTDKQVSQIAMSFDQPHRLGVFLDLSCDLGVNFIQRARGLMNSSYEWVLWGPKDNEELTTLLETDIGLSTKMSLLTEEREVKEVFRTHHTIPHLQIHTRGHWSEEGRNLKLQEEDPRKDFEGATLDVSLMMIDIPLGNEINLTRLLDPNYLRGRDAMRRYSLTLYLHLPEMFNYRYRVSRMWGEPTGKGGYSGLLGQIQRKEVDYGTGLLKHDTYRFALADYLTTLSSVRVCFSFLQPKLIGSPKALLIPLTPKLWMGLWLVTLLAALVFRLTGHYDTTSRSNEGLSGSFLLTLAALAQQGIPDDTWKTSTRILYLFYLWMTFMVGVYYNTAVLNGLLLPAPNALQTYKQLLMSDLRLGVTDHEYYKAEVEKNTTPAHWFRERVARKQKKMKLYLSISEGVMMVKNSSFAFYSEDENIYAAMEGKFTDAEVCGLSEIEMTRPFQVAGIVRDNSHLKETFNRGFLLMRERGILKRASDQWHLKKPFCQWKQDAISFSLKPVVVAFIVLAIGSLLTFFFLAIEIMYHKRFQRDTLLN